MFFLFGNFFLFTSLQAWHSMGVKVKDCLLLYEGVKSCEVCETSPQSTASLLHHGARYVIPFSKDFPHFEVGMKILFVCFVRCLFDFLTEYSRLTWLVSCGFLTTLGSSPRNW